MRRVRSHRPAPLLAALALSIATGAVGAAGAARAEPVVLRFATVAPEGTAWARLAKSTSRALAEATGGQVTGKWYFNGIAGNELEMAARVRKDQLDGIVSGGMLCQKLAPSMRVLRVVGLFQTRDESGYVAGRLKPVFDEEFRKAGFVNLGEVGIGPDLVFSREPIRSMQDLKKTRFWIWDLDEMFGAEWPLIGAPVVATRLDEAWRAYDHHLIDGFLAVPSAALAFQWSTEAHYMTDLRVSFLRSCILVSTRAFDALPLEAQQALLTSSAKGMMQLEELGRSQDDALLGGLFAKQGIKPVPVSDAFRSEFFATALAAREQLPRALVDPKLLQRVLSLLADFRAEHRNAEAR